MNEKKAAVAGKPRAVKKKAAVAGKPRAVKKKAAVAGKPRAVKKKAGKAGIIIAGPQASQWAAYRNIVVSLAERLGGFIPAAKAAGDAAAREFAKILGSAKAETIPLNEEFIEWAKGLDIAIAKFNKATQALDYVSGVTLKERAAVDSAYRKYAKALDAIMRKWAAIE